ncbi:MAG: hypothetical protein ACPGVG_18965, partial [Mycobacterium sp.]
TVPVGNAWTPVTGFGGPYAALADEWFACAVWPGPLDGQLIHIAPARAAGQFNERLGEISSGHYLFQGGTYPGTTAPPDNQIPQACYGLSTVELSL